MRSAAAVLKDMDSTVEPCEDFYQFACGNFIKKAVIPEGVAQVMRATEMLDKINDQVHHLLQQPTFESDAPPLRMVKQLYAACMNTTQIEKVGMQPLIDQVESLGGWPVVKGGSWNESAWSWQKSVAQFRNCGFDMNYFFTLDVGSDPQNGTKRIIYVSDCNALKFTNMITSI